MVSVETEGTTKGQAVMIEIENEKCVNEKKDLDLEPSTVLPTEGLDV